LATPNYGFEKRQKELAKKRKKEDKLKAKAERKTGSPSDDGMDDADQAPATIFAAPAPAADKPAS
jgi:hypothetical protein